MNSYKLPILILLAIISSSVSFAEASSSIKGQGFMKTRGGSVITCAGNSVYLDNSADDSNYVGLKGLAMAEESWLKASTGLLQGQVVENQEDRKKHNEVLAGHMKTITKLAKYNGNMIETICDAQGYFEFENLGTGMYEIGTTVEWFAGDEKQGGFISKTVNVKSGKNKVFITE